MWIYCEILLEKRRLRCLRALLRDEFHPFVESSFVNGKVELPDPPKHVSLILTSKKCTLFSRNYLHPYAQDI